MRASRRLPLVMLAVIAFASLATAHPQIDRAIPPVGSTVPTSLPEIRIFFTQPITPAASSIELTTADGKAVAIGSAAGDPKDPAQLFAKLPTLPLGKYRVHWRVTGVDTHELDGHYTFEVR